MKRQCAVQFIIFLIQNDRAESYDLKSLLWLFFSTLNFPPKIKMVEEKKINSKNRDYKSCLSARSFKIAKPKTSCSFD